MEDGAHYSFVFCFSNMLLGCGGGIAMIRAFEKSAPTYQGWVTAAIERVRSMEEFLFFLVGRDSGSMSEVTNNAHHE